MGTGQTNLPFAGPLLDAVRLFEELQIQYALVGGVAAMYYGRLRLTEDLEFVADPGHMDVRAVNSGVMTKNHFDPSCTWKLCHDSGLEMDILKDEHAAEIIARSRNVELQGHTIRIAEPHDLVAMKLRAGRLQDDYDISQITQNLAIDDKTIQDRVTPQQFQHFLDVKKRK